MSVPPTLTVLSLGGGVQSSVMPLISRDKIQISARHSRTSMSYTAFISLCRQAGQLYISFTMSNDSIRNPHRTSG